VTSILIISDTHNYLDARWIPYIKLSDEVWHAGDIGTLSITEEISKFKPVRAVYGNIDGQDLRNVYPLINRFRCEEVEIAMTHIAGYPTKYKPDALTILKENIPGILICGHSHILKVMRDQQNRNMLFINPGAAGIHGFQTVQTAIQIKIEGKRIYDLEVIELKRATFNNPVL
jgi:putative phosphoesterase